MQASPSGMASASQADFGGSDSRRLLQKQSLHFCGGFVFALSIISTGVGGWEAFCGSKTFLILWFSTAHGELPNLCL